MPQPWGPNLDYGEHVIIIGVPQSGKSTFARRFTNGAKRVVYFDPHGDYEKCGRVIRPVDLEEKDILKGDPKTGRLRMVIAAERSEVVDVADEFIYCARKCREAESHGGLVFLCDEVGDYSAKAGRHIAALFRNGHKNGICTVLVSQRAVDIPLGCRATGTRVFSFLQNNPKDIARLEEDYGEEFASGATNWKAGEPPVIYVRPRPYG